MSIQIYTIHAENPLVEIWQRLRLFADPNANVERIKRDLDPAANPGDRNIRKQAEQIGYCIRQAEEYFHAAAHVRLPTRPLLLYYGASSLGQALVLLKKDGKHSIDFLRKQKRHNHHGLEVVGEPKAHNYLAGPKSFFDSITAQPFTKFCRTGSDGREQGGAERREPWGAFALFYGALSAPCFVIPRTTTVGSYTLTDHCVRRTAEIQPYERLAARKIAVSEIFGSLPDLKGHLPWPGDLCNGSQKLVAHKSGVADPIEPRVDQFFLAGVRGDQRDQIVGYYQKNMPGLQQRLVGDGVLMFEYRHVPGSPLAFFPDMVDDVGGRLYYVTNPAGYIVEPAAMYIALFSFGMLARYYPDVWMRIESDPRATALVNTFLGIVQRKFPHLMLDQMEGAKHIIAP